jgi:hypothetical protein
MESAIKSWLLPMIRDLTSLTFLTILISSQALAGEVKCKSTVDVEYYIQFNLPDKANECLNKLIDQDPTNPKLNLPKLRLLRGEYCLKQGNTSCAKERFGSDAVKQKYGKEIAGLYKKEGDAKLDAGSMQQADNLYTEALSYDRAMKEEITKSLFDKGKQAARTDCFRLAVKYDPLLKPAAADHYHSLSVATKHPEEKTDLLGKAAEFDAGRYGTAYTNSKMKLGRSYLDKAIAYAKQSGKDEECERSKIIARKYLGDPIVDKELPDIKYFGEGLHSLGTYKAGEQTPYWFTYVAGSFNLYIITTNGNRNFMVITRTHERFTFSDDTQRKEYLSRNWDDTAIKIQFLEPMECTLRVAKK